MSQSRSLRWHALIALLGVVGILSAGAVVIVRLLAVPEAEITRALLERRHDEAVRILALLILGTAAFLLAVFFWIRRRIVGELGRLVRLIEAIDPEPSGERMLPPMRVSELERLRVAFSRFFDRFAASRVRQEAAEGTLGYVLDHAVDAILVLDRAHRIISWNRGAEETFGFTAQEVQNREYALLVPGGREEGELSTPLEPGSTVKDFRTRRLHRDGQPLDVSLTRSRIPAVEGGEERFVEILRDISETRRIEEDLLRTEKMAAVGKISSKVVHEIRNPLASINLNVDLLRDSLESPAGPPDPEALETLGVIKREVRRLSHITEEYLQFSRLPRADFRRERVNDILVELSDFVRPTIHRKGVQLVLQLDDGDPETVCDATLLRQALLNLLRNAVDAVEEGKGRIQMTTRTMTRHPGGSSGGEPREAEVDRSAEARPTPPPTSSADLGQAVEIAVEDNGRGIPPEDLDRIYEPFYTTKKDGTGLGLALVLRAVEEHGGFVRCQSVPGRGTTFRVFIPSRPPGESGAAPTA